MKKLLAMAVVALLAPCLCSCSIVQEVQADDDGAPLGRAAFNRFVDALDSGDTQALKGMFASNATSADKNLDSEVDQLITLLPDGVWSWQGGGCNGSGGQNDFGRDDLWVYCGYAIVLDSPTPVNLYFTLGTYSSYDPGNVGFLSMTVIAGDDTPPPIDSSTPPPDAHNPEIRVPVLYVSKSPPIIGGRP